MSIVFKDANVFFAGYKLHSQMNQVSVEKGAESLDATVFGNSSRVRRGGLKTGMLSGSGFWEAGVSTDSVDAVLFDSLALSDVVVMAFPETITEGATSTGSGYMCKGELLRYNIGGTIGELTPFTLEVTGRGV